LNRSLVSKTGASISWNKRFSENEGAEWIINTVAPFPENLNPLPPGSSISKDVIDPFRPSTGHKSQKFFKATCGAPPWGASHIYPPPSPSSTRKQTSSISPTLVPIAVPLPPPLLLSRRLGEKKASSSFAPVPRHEFHLLGKAQTPLALRPRGGQGPGRARKGKEGEKKNFEKFPFRGADGLMPCFLFPSPWRGWAGKDRMGAG
jgi:hypothetical protein